MKKLIFMGALLLSTIMFGVEVPMLSETSYGVAKNEIGRGKAVMLEVGSDMCGSCRDMGKMLFRVKQSEPETAIYFINVRFDRSVANTLGVAMIPTQIIYNKEGKEVYRHIGPLSTDELYGVLTEYKVRDKR